MAMTREEFAAEFNRLAELLTNLCVAEGRVVVIASGLTVGQTMNVNFCFGGDHDQLSALLLHLIGQIKSAAIAVREALRAVAN